MYLGDLNEDFLYKNYSTHWPIQMTTADKLSLEDQVCILNLNLRFAT